MNGLHVSKFTNIFALTLNRAGNSYVGCGRGKSAGDIPNVPYTDIAALTVALMGGTALAQPANGPPTNLNGNPSNSARNAPDMTMITARRRPGPPRASGRPAAGAQGARPQADRDMFCRRDAAARTGYTTPREAARDEQTRGTVGGTWAARRWAPSSARGAGNAGAGCRGRCRCGPDRRNRHRRRQCAPCGARCGSGLWRAYYACMHEDGRQAAYDRRRRSLWLWLRRRRLRLLRPPYPYPYYALPIMPAYYGPSVSFGFGFGGGHGWGGALVSMAAAGVATAKDELDTFARKRPGLYGPGRFLFRTADAAESQSRQAQSVAAAHPDPAAGHRAHSRRGQATPEGDTAITQFPHAHGDHFHLGDAMVNARDATGLENENVWNALPRKGLIKCAWPDQIALTPEGIAYHTGMADQILHKGEHH